MPHPRNGRIIVIGDVMIDVVVTPEGPVRHASDRRATIRALPGGQGANQAACIAAFGGEATLVARIGRDDERTQTAALRRAGVEPVLSLDEDARTGMLIALISPDGERSFLTDRGANRSLASDDLPARLLDDRTRLVHVSGYALFEPGPRAAVLAFATGARRRGIPVTLDPASSGFIEEAGAAAFLDWSRFASICFPNEDEARLLAGTPVAEEQCDRLAQHYGFVVIKRGPLGAEAADAQGGRWSAAAPEVSVVDTSGAGDAFAAAFLLAHLDGAGVQDCLDAAVAAGARATTHPGARPD